MKSKTLLRIAAGLVLFFAIGHTMGHLSRYDVKDEKAKAVVHAMQDTRFDLFGEMRSFDENYTGMSLNLIFTLLAFAAVIWVVSGHIINQRKLIVTLLVPVALCLLAFAVTSYLYFFMVPALTSLLAGVLIFVVVIRKVES